MTSPAPQERRSWLPLILAGVFVIFAVGVALLTYATNRTGDPSKASTVDDVAALSVEAVETADLDFAEELLCAEGAADVAAVFDRGSDAVASTSALTGVETGTFVLTVDGDDVRVTVGRDGSRSCIEAVGP